MCLRRGTGVGGRTVWEVLPSASTPGLAQARSCLSFFPEALAQQGSLRAHAQGSFSQGPGHVRKAASTCPAGCQEEAGAQPSSGAPTHMLALSLCACSRHYPQNSSRVGPSRETRADRGIAAPMASAQDQDRPALRPSCASRDFQGLLLTLLSSLPPRAFLWAVLWA